MRRRTFLPIPAVTTLALAGLTDNTPAYRLTTPYKRSGSLGMPGPYPGVVAAVHAPRCIEEATRKVDQAQVAAMMDRGMKDLTGASSTADAWRRFFDKSDVVGIKVNCSGSPKVMSSPEVVSEIIKNLMAVGIPPRQITIYERFDDQLKDAGYERHVPKETHITAIELPRRSIRGYDSDAHVEVNFFGEDDTRSNLVRLVTERFTKIVNVPNMKDHGAAGVTGCLKNIAYGNYHNVARSHYQSKTNTRTFIGTLASMEPLRSKAVLHVMDGLKGVWHGGPFVRDDRFVFFPKQMMFGTDPVAMDRLLIDVIENKRKAEGVVSVWERSLDHISYDRKKTLDPNFNHYVREPGHIEYAGGLELGVYDRKAIRLRESEV